MRLKDFFLVFSFCLLKSISANILDSSMTKGMALVQEKDYKNAIIEFDHCILQTSNDAEAYFQRGTCYLLLNKHNIALVDFNQALRLDSSIYEAYYNRALAEHAIKNYTFSEADFLLYKSRVPKDDRVLNSLALLMEDMQEYKSAIMYYTEFLKLQRIVWGLSNW